MRYEGYGPGGVAVIVEALTDNRNRTAGEVRSAFSKHGGSLGETNSVSFMFDRVGEIIYPLAAASADAMMEAAIEAGAEDCATEEEVHRITSTAEDFLSVREALGAKFGDPAEAKVIWRPQNSIPVDEERAQALLKMLDTLEDSDDVQNVYANFEVADDVMRKLSA